MLGDLLDYIYKLGYISYFFFTYFLNSFPSGLEPTTSLKLLIIIIYFHSSTNKSEFSQHAAFDTAQQSFPPRTTFSLGFQGTAFASFSCYALPALQPLSVGSPSTETLVVLLIYFSTQALGFLFKAHGLQYLDTPSPPVFTCISLSMSICHSLFKNKTLDHPP